MASAVVQAVAFFLFSSTFPNNKIVVSRWLIVALLFLCGVTISICFSPILFSDVIIENGKRSPVVAPGMLFFILTAVGSLVAGFITLVKRYFKQSGIVKVQYRYIFLGTSIMFFLIVMFNFVLVVIFGNSQFVNYSPTFVLPFAIATGYAISKHQLMDVRLVILRTITYSILVLAVSTIVVTGAVYIPSQISNGNIRAVIEIGISILLVAVLDPLKKMIGRVSDRYFFKAKINFDRVARKISLIVNKEIDQTRLLDELGRELTTQLKIVHASVYLPSNGDLKYVDYFNFNNLFDDSSSIVKYLKHEGKVIVFESLERRIEDTTDEKERIELERSKEELDQLKAAVVSPVITSDGRIAAILVLGGKLSGDPYSNEDLNLLQLLGPQLASALEKARLYEEIRLFNAKLQKEVEIATEKVKMKNVQLEDRNRFLSAVSKVTSLITQTLEFKKVTQSIVDAIATELGFVGGLLLFLGESRRKVFPEAVTNKPVTEKVLKLLPKPLNEYWGDFTTDKTLNIEAMKAQQVRTGTDLAAFLSPPVPKMVLGAIQKVAGIKTIVSVPVVAEQEVVGCIDFMIAKTPDLVTKNDYDMMQAMANQTGVVYRNIELVRRLESSNRELGEANEHLKELDQAKSEFVSIASHQLRTPMTGIMGYLSMIVGGDFGKLDAGLQKVLEQLLDASQRMIRLINLFLDVTKIESGKLSLDKQPVQLEELIEKELQVLQKLASDKKLKLVYTKPKVALPTLMIDDKITDVVLNLVDNAIKYTETGGITITSEREGDWVHVKVQDTGRGLDPKEARSLFNKFVRGYGIAQVNPDGSGLGLYVARRLVEVHGGRIWVESDGPGKGSCFQFTLPIKAVDAKFEPAGAALVSSPKPVVE